MDLEAQPRPLHTRALAVTVTQRADGRLDARGEILDLRKCGFVPIAGDLQTSGIVHRMEVAAVVDPGTDTLERVEAAQPVVAFEASPATGGESCRDPVGRIGALAGVRLDRGYARSLRRAIGGPLGCTHVLTLAQLLGPTVRFALDVDRLRGTPPGARAPGERVFRRDLVYDGRRAPEGDLEVDVQQTDLHFAPAPADARPMDRFAGQGELRARARVRLEDMTLLGVDAIERRRAADELDSAAWRDREGAVAELAGLRLGAGVAPELVRRLGGRPDDAPLLDALLGLAPACIQCVASLSDTWAIQSRASDSRVVTGGLPDSCTMWRRGGALDRAREDEVASGALPLLRP